MENDDVQFNSSSSSFDSVVGTAPSFGFQASDILHSQESDDGDSSSFTGIGDIGLGFSAPTLIGVSGSNDSQDYSSSSESDGGLLGGLL
jgi:hypothetical protein